MTVEKLNLRSSPKIDKNIVGIIGKDSKVKIVEIIDNNWVKISTSDNEGFVASEYLQKVE